MDINNHTLITNSGLHMMMNIGSVIRMRHPIMDTEHKNWTPKTVKFTLTKIGDKNFGTDI